MIVCKFPIHEMLTLEAFIAVGSRSIRPMSEVGGGWERNTGRNPKWIRASAADAAGGGRMRNNLLNRASQSGMIRFEVV